MQKVESFPLQWPHWQKRTNTPEAARFGEHSIAEARDEIFRQIELLGGRYPTISSNMRVNLDGMLRSTQRRPDDCGIAVYFELDGKPICLACDAWTDPAHNLWAIAKDIDAQRGRRRWGVGSTEQAFAGYQALPAPESKKEWHEVLGIPKDSDAEAIRAKFRELALKNHTDKGGDRAKWDELQVAYWEGLRSKESKV